MLAFFCRLDGMINRVFTKFSDPINFLIRLYLAEIFLSSAWTKVISWQSTLSLFKYEYTVPLLDPTLAAWLGTGAEIILPILLLLGFGGRISILAFFLFNLFAVMSYEFLWTDDGSTGLTDHMQWGLMLLMLIAYGYGKWSLDYLIHRRCCKKNN